jgi:hypothetical protein
MINVYEKNQTMRLIQSLFGLALLTVGIWAFRWGFPGIVWFFHILFLATAIFLLLSWPTALSSHRYCIKKILKTEITPDELRQFSKEYKSRRQVFRGMTIAEGSIVALTEHWVYEYAGKDSDLFPISHIETMSKEILCHSTNNQLEATDVNIRLSFRDERTVLIRIQKIKPTEPIENADEEFQKVLQFLHSRAPRAIIA